MAEQQATDAQERIKDAEGHTASAEQRASEARRHAATSEGLLASAEQRASAAEAGQEAAEARAAAAKAAQEAAAEAAAEAAERLAYRLQVVTKGMHEARSERDALRTAAAGARHLPAVDRLAEGEGVRLSQAAAAAAAAMHTASQDASPVRHRPRPEEPPGGSGGRIGALRKTSARPAPATAPAAPALIAPAPVAPVPVAPAPGGKLLWPNLAPVVPAPFGRQPVVIISQPLPPLSIPLGAKLLLSEAVLPDGLSPRALVKSLYDFGRLLCVCMRSSLEEAPKLIRFVEHWRLPSSLAPRFWNKDSNEGKKRVYFSSLGINTFASVEYMEDHVVIRIILRSFGYPNFALGEIRAICDSLPACSRVYPGLVTGEEVTTFLWMLKGPHLSVADFQVMLHAAPAFGQGVVMLRCPTTLMHEGERSSPNHIFIPQGGPEMLVPHVSWGLAAAAFANYTAWSILLTTILLPRLESDVGQLPESLKAVMRTEVVASLHAIRHYHECFRLLAGDDATARLLPMGPIVQIPDKLTVDASTPSPVDMFSSADEIRSSILPLLTTCGKAGLTKLRAKTNDYFGQDTFDSQSFPSSEQQKHSYPDRFHQILSLCPTPTSYLHHSLLRHIDPGVDSQHILGTFVLQRSRCFVSGETFSMSGDRARHNLAPSCDRILHGGRHLAANLRMVTFAANVLRRDRY